MEILYPTAIFYGVIGVESMTIGTTSWLTLDFTSVTTSEAGQYTCKSVVEHPSSTKYASHDVIVISKLNN